MKTNENLNEKLKLLGLDLENVPDKLKFFQNINFRVHKNYNEKNYKVYKYIDINDIEIFLTPTNRLTDYTEKCAKAVPIGAYLSSDTDEDIARNIEFLNIVKDFQPEQLEILENQQLQFSKSIPYNVKYNKDYLWQIYYQEASKKYFMLMPIKETECTALLYTIKKQIQNKSKKIYVPICYENYSNKYLNKEEIEEIEKYLCYFAKEWPSIYEVYDKLDNMSMQITGKATIYDNVKSTYKIKLDEQGQAEDFYKLLKVLFILETQLSHHYKFNIKINKLGDMHYYFNDKEILYKELLSFIKTEYIKGLEQVIKSKETKINLENKLKKLKNLSKTLDMEYYEKEKQISTFLECKKSFFGRVRYFIKYKKKKIQNEQTVPFERQDNCKLKYCERTDIKDAYTLEELLTLYTNLDQEINVIKDLEQDIDALNKRIDILQTKIKNATQYIKEIDEHKKSIFEFWKFTNKDEAKQLNEGIAEPSERKKLKKPFNYELDFEDVSKQLDKIERNIYTKEETDNIYLTTTEVLKDINSIINNENVLQESLDKLKEELKEEPITTFDIFGSTTSSKDEIKTLGNIKHRENKKNKFAVLNINETTGIQEYTDKLCQVYEGLKESINKFKNTIEIPVYKAGDLSDGLNIFYMNPENAIKSEQDETNLYKITLKEGQNCIPLTNIMYYNNTNKTLPLGMHVTDGILLNLKDLNLELKQKDKNYIIKPNGDTPKPDTLKINIFEYEIC